MKEELRVVDVLVVGSGIGGATAALETARRNPDSRVFLLTRTDNPNDTNTSKAQGGIVAKGGADLVDDILRAGDGIGLPAATQTLVAEGPDCVKKILIDLAHVQFDRKKNGELAYGLEGGHSEARVAKVDGETGRAIQEGLTQAVRDRSNIEIATGITAVDLLTLEHHSNNWLRKYEPNSCVGIYAYDKTDGRVSRILAKKTVLATGGSGQIYAYSTNPPGARGDGFALASRAKVELLGMEFEQFHPTALKLQGAPPFLISEAVRGAGSVVVDAKGRAFMKDYYPYLNNPNLATRDKVSRAIFDMMLKTGEQNMYLDAASHIPADVIKTEFSAIYKQLLKYGIDMTTTPIPIAPAAHYTVGGVRTDLDGHTSIRNLYAVGEVSYTGLHGGNRLASTSLLEGLVFGSRAGKDMSNIVKIQAPWSDPSEIMPWKDYGKYIADPALIAADINNVRNIMWNMVGLVRKTKLLERAMRDLTYLQGEIMGFYLEAVLSDELLGLRNSITTALLVTEQAYANPRSIGCHWRE